jgi:hypothetical protein
MEYRHTQWGRLSVPLILLGTVAVVLLVAADDETSTFAASVIAAFIVAISALLLLTSRLEVTVGNGSVTAAFGFGWPRKTVVLADVKEVRRVRNRWWYGFGIRKIPDGWMYNVWGLEAIDVEYETGKVFRIGTDDPENLLAVLSLLTTK